MRMSVHAIETSEFGGDLISAQVGAAQQGKTKNLVFNTCCLHDLTLQVQLPSSPVAVLLQHFPQSHARLICKYAAACWMTTIPAKRHR
jgi:hypothetical protein